MAATATPAQISFLSTLCSRRRVPVAVASLLALATATPSRVSAREISQAIDAAKASPWAEQRTVTAEKGYYLVDCVVHAVVASKETGNLYAKRLVIGTTASGAKHASWEYAKGGIYACTPDRRLSLDEAKAMGKLHGICMICGKQLTDVQSVENGIGPVCAKRL